MKKLLLSALTFLTVSTETALAKSFYSECNTSTASNKVINAPIAEYYQRQYDMNKPIDVLLSERNTINPFLAWNYYLLNNKDRQYGLAWNISATTAYNNKNAIRLNTPNWNYFYPNKQWNYWRDRDAQNSFVTDISWKHGAEYGATVAMDYTDNRFADAFAVEVNFKSSLNKAHGVMLDWWHVHQPLSWSKSERTQAMLNIADKIREVNGDDYLIIGNTNGNKNKVLAGALNGVFLELVKKQSSRNYTCNELAHIESVIEFNEKTLQEPKIIAVNGQRKTSSDDKRERNSKENFQYARLITAMSAVIPEHGYVLFGDNNRDFDDGDHLHSYYDFYNIDLGKPISKRTTIKKGVAYKKYEDGLIAYNRLKRDVTVKIENKTITIPSMDAVFFHAN